VHFHNPDGPSRLVSLSYIDYAGVSTDDWQSSVELLQVAFELVKELKVEHLEFRQDALYPLPSLSSCNF
jgi:hypothetical protein